MYLTFSVILFLPLVSAITFETPTNFTSGGPATINWTPDSSDPDVFSLELVNPSFHNSFAIGNNIRTAAGTVNVNLPIVPAGDNYQLKAVQISNIDNVFGTSSQFTIAPTVTTTSSPASTASALSSVSGASSAATTGATSSGPGNSASSSGSSQASSTSASSFNGNGALGRSIDRGNVGSIVAAIVGIVAGAVLV